MGGHCRSQSQTGVWNKKALHEAAQLAFALRLKNEGFKVYLCKSDQRAYAASPSDGYRVALEFKYPLAKNYAGAEFFFAYDPYHYMKSDCSS